MNKKQIALVIAVLATIFIELPIGIFIWYTVLKSIGVSSLVWFLFVARIPITVVTTVIVKMFADAK